MKHPFYLAYGALVLLLSGFFEYRGVPLAAGLNQAKHIPRTVRDNPGSSRPSYGYFPHIFGGK